MWQTTARSNQVIYITTESATWWEGIDSAYKCGVRLAHPANSHNFLIPGAGQVRDRRSGRDRFELYFEIRITA